MTATIKLYKDCKILKEKNFIVDDIADYLSTLSYTKTIENFQFQKNALEISINIDEEQASLEYLRSNNFNYLEVQNENGKKVYYFIKRKIWRAKQTIALELEMDVLNTLKYGTDYTLTDKTLIKRTHKNRFKKTNEHDYIISYDYSDIGDDTLLDWIKDGYRIVFQTFYPEEIIPTTAGIYAFFYDSEDNKLHEDTLRINIPFNREVGHEETYDCCTLYFGQENNLLRLQGRDWDGNVVFTSYIDFDTQFNISLVTPEGEYEYIDSDMIDSDYYRDFSQYAIGYFKKVSNKYAIIDLASEGINPPLYKNQLEVQTLKESESNLDWYLIYKNQNEPSDSLVNPVETYVCASKNIRVQFPAEEKITADNLSSGTYYYLLYPSNGGVGFSINDGEFTDAINEACGLRYSKDGTKIKIELCIFLGNPDIPPQYIDIGASVGHNFDNIQFFGDSFIIRYGSNANDNYSTIISYPYTLHRGSEPSIKAIRSIDNLDRTSAKLIKVIKLPYAPFTIVENSEDLFTFDLNQYGYDPNTGFIRVNNFGTKFKNQIRSNINNPLKVLDMDDFDPYLSDNKSAEREVKLLHSDFYQPKFYYDSFSFTYNLEKVNLDSFINDKDREFFKFDFYPTTTMNSRFLFTFNQYITKYGTQDYDNIMIVNRNNEEVLFNVPYVNYMRNGYNYDVKAKDRQIVFSGVQSGLALGGVIASSMSGNPLGFAAAGVLISSILTGLNNTINAEESLKRKQEELQNQSASVRGADDIDLLSIYGENKVKFAIYQPSEVVKKLLFDLFYYTGYIANYQATPNVTSRMWFNYLMCDPQYKDLANIPTELLDKLTSKFNEGVTFLHNNMIGTTKTWEFEQTKENWERDLF